MNTLTTDNVLRIYAALEVHFSSSGDPMVPSGVHDMNLLESAVARQYTALGSVMKYPDPRSNAAALMYGICMNHCFRNGNKRTALVAGLVHLDANGICPHNVSHNEFYNMILLLAQHRIGDLSELKQISRDYRKKGFLVDGRPSPDVEVELLTRWLSRKTRSEDKREHPLTFRELRRILEANGCEFGMPRQNFIDIYGPQKEYDTKILFVRVRKTVPRAKVQVSYPGEGHVLSVSTIKMIRRQFELTSEHGVDSAAFYDQEAVVDSILNSYRNLLRRLAQV